MDSMEFIEMLSKCLKNYKRGLISLEELEEMVYKFSFDVVYDHIIKKQ